MNREFLKHDVINNLKLLRWRMVPNKIYYTRAGVEYSTMDVDAWIHMIINNAEAHNPHFWFTVMRISNELWAQVKR